MTKLLDSQIIQALLEAAPKSSADLSRAKKQIAKKFKINLPTNAELIKIIKELPSQAEQEALLLLLRKRAIRTMSGVAPVAVLIKPYKCPGNCVYCPKADNAPQSYLPNEPAVMRAIHCDYDPVKQVQYRLRALEANGHAPQKIELIVIGGTWSYYPKKYQYWYIASLFFGANNYRKNNTKIAPAKTDSLENLRKILIREQKKNEKSTYRIIGLTLETRPDYINEKELQEMRFLGATRIELGIQAIDDEILKLNKRGSDTKDIKRAMALIRAWGFKTTWHFMPALPGSNPKKDLAMYQEMFTPENNLAKTTFALKKEVTDRAIKKITEAETIDSDYNPDQLKFYPTVVTEGSELYDWWRQGLYKPYSNEELIKLIFDCKKYTPPFVRIIRLIRDIPEESILAGNKITNLRQLVQKRGAVCRCIRCREAKHAKLSKDKAFLIIRKYQASGGEEYFLSIEDKDEKILYGFLRLRIEQSKKNPFKTKTAFVRELHVYGQLVAVGQAGKTQHQGLGKKLLTVAELIAKSHQAKRLAIISGVGVRDYYRRLGYKLSKTYLVKPL